MQLKSGTLLKGGEYKIEKVLGQGGFGITYLGEQVSLKRKVAIKEFFMKEYCERDTDTSSVSLGTSGSKELVEKFREKFVKEAQNIASFSHNNIIKIYDVFEENNTAYYVMEYLDCGSLSDYLSDRGRLSEDESLNFIRQIADALSYIHEHRVNHLDVKPGNILLDKKQNAILIDFGLSKHYDERGGQTSSTPVGISRGYAPMEQYKQGGVSKFSPESDIYSLGATLYKMVTGSTPPEADDVNENGLSFPGNVRLSERIKQSITFAMQPKRKDRPQSVGEFLMVLESKTPPKEDTYVEVKVEPEPDPVPVPVPSPNPKKKWMILVITAIVLCLGGYYSYDGPIKSYRENQRVMDSIQFVQDSLHNINCKRIADYNNLLDCICRYKRIGDFVDGLAPAGDSLMGYINLSGEVVIPFKYGETTPFVGEMARVYNKDYIGFINKNGDEIIPPSKYESYGILSWYFKEGLIPVSYKNKVGFIDTLGNVVIPFQFDAVNHFKDGLAVVQLGDRIGVINKLGKLIIPFAYEHNSKSDRGFIDGLLCVKNAATKKWGYLDESGKEVIPCIYDEANCFSMGLASVRYDDNDNYWRYIDRNGKVAIPFNYRKAFDFKKDGIAVVKSFYYQLIDKNGNIILDRMDNISDYGEGYIAARQKDYNNGKYGFYDIYGNNVIPCKYDYVHRFRNGISVICNKDNAGNLMYGCINKMGVEIIEPQYDHVSNYDKYNLIRLKTGDKYGFANYKGELIVPVLYAEYDIVRISTDTVLIRVKNQEQVSIYDNLGNKIR